jgi:hypothetical protein
MVIFVKEMVGFEFGRWLSFAASSRFGRPKAKENYTNENRIY